MANTRAMGREKRAREGRRALVVAAAAALLGGRGAAAAEEMPGAIRNLAGDYELSTNVNTTGVTIDGKNAYELIVNASKLSDEVGHIIAELHNFNAANSNWADMSSDYDEKFKPFVEGSGLKSNEYTWITTKDLLQFDGSVTTTTTPLEKYIDDAVAKATSTGFSNFDTIKEVIEKTVWDAVGYQASLKALATAQSTDATVGGVCPSPTGSPDTPIVKAHWDLGAMIIIGDAYHSVLGRAQKRGFEFGTLGSTGISKAYEKIVKLLRAGKEASTCDDLHEIYERIESQMRVVYSQSILKYVFKIDKGLATGSLAGAYHDLHAEGQAMYRVIAGDMLRKYPAGAAFFNGYFNIASAPTASTEWNYGKYCEARRHLVSFIETMSSHDVTAADLGTYADAANIDCDYKTNSDPSLVLKTMAGPYYPSDLSSNSVPGALAKFKKARDLSANVAHIIAELATYIEDSSTTEWGDMSSDFTEDYAEWTETSSVQSNEWKWATRNYSFPKADEAGSNGVSTSPLTNYIVDAVTLAGRDDQNHEAAKEMIEKTMLDAVGYFGALNQLSHAQKPSTEGGACVDGQQSDAKDAAWDTAAALLIGDDYHSVLGRAQKRGVEFGTVGAAHFAKPYENIVKLLRWGQMETTCSTLHEIYEKIEKELRIVYSQSVIKYAYKIDAALAAGRTLAPYGDDQAEGQGFYRVVAPDVKRKGAQTKVGFDTVTNAYQFFDNLFDVRTAPTAGSWAYDNYCTSIYYLSNALKIEPELFGTYYEAHHVNCVTKKAYTSSNFASVIEAAYGGGKGASNKEIRGVEALAAFTFVVALAALVVGSVALHKTRKGSASAFKSSYVVHNV